MITDKSKMYNIIMQRCITLLSSIIPLPPAKQTWKGCRDFKTGKYGKPDAGFAPGLREVLDITLLHFIKACFKSDNMIEIFTESGRNNVK